MSDAPFGSVENGLEMGKLEDSEEVVTETQVRKKECERRGGIEKRHQLRRLRRHFVIWCLGWEDWQREWKKWKAPRVLLLFLF